MRHIKNFQGFSQINEARDYTIHHGFTGPLTEEQIRFIDNNMDKLEGGSWEYNPKTDRVDITKGSFKCQKMRLTDFMGISFGDVKGDFRCGDNQLTSDVLIHFPRTIGGNFLCYRNKLTSLVNGPVHVEGEYNVKFNKLVTLEGLPADTRTLSCEGNKLTDLKFCPTSIETVRAPHNKIATFEGAPMDVDLLDLDSNKFIDFDGMGTRNYRTLYMGRNKIQSFEGMGPSKTIERLYMSSNKIRTLEGIPDLPSCHLALNDNPLESFKGIGELRTISFTGGIRPGENWRDSVNIDLNEESLLDWIERIEEPRYSDLTKEKFMELLETQISKYPTIAKTLYERITPAISARIRAKSPVLWREVLKHAKDIESENVSADLGDLGF